MHKKLTILATALVPLLLFAMLASAERGAASIEKDPAAPELVVLLGELVRHEQRILFDALVTGDMSLLPSVYVNDAEITMHSDYELVLDLFGTEAHEIQASLGDGPIGDETGYLTARIASLLNRNQGVQLWEAAIATAASEDRDPTIFDLPEGASPVERISEDQWIEPDYHLYNTWTWDDQASVDVAFGPSAGGGQIFSYRFKHIGDQWYVTYMEASWSLGEPDYQGPGMPPDLELNAQ